MQFLTGSKACEPYGLIRCDSEADGKVRMKEDRPRTSAVISIYAPSYGAFSIFFNKGGFAVKNILHNVFLSIGLGTVIFVPMLIIDKGLNDTLVSVLIWFGASILYGLSFTLLKLKTKLRLPIHILSCFLLTLVVRCGYSYYSKGSIDFTRLFLITIPIFILIYMLMYFYMRYFGNVEFIKKNK